MRLKLKWEMYQLLRNNTQKYWEALNFNLQNLIGGDLENKQGHSREAQIHEGDMF